MTRWSVYLALGLLAAALYVAPGPLHASETLIGVVGLSSLVATIYAIVRLKPVAPRAWSLLALGLVLVFVGDLVPDGPGADLPDAFFVAMYPAMMAGIALLVRSRRRGADMSSLIDGLIVAIGLALPTWVALVAPYLEQAHDVGLAQHIANLAYPLGDVILLGAAAQLALDGGRRSASLRMLLASIGVLLVIDFAAGLLTVAGTLDQQVWLDGGWMIAYVLWGASVLHPSMAGLAEPSPDRDDVLLTRPRLVLLMAAALIAPTISALHHLREGELTFVVVDASSLMLFGLVVARMARLAARQRALGEELHRRRGEERFAALVRHTADLLFVLEPGGGVGYASPSVERILGPVDDAFRSREDRERTREAIAAVRAGESVPPFELTLIARDGQERVFEVELTDLSHDAHVGGILAHAHDVTERKAFEAELTHQAFHDPVTGLANRSLFVERVRQAIAHGRRADRSLAVLFLDLDDFKLVNDSLGHAVGDEVLVEVARRIDGDVRGVDTAARFGGDEFALLLEDVDGHAAAEAARRILEVLSAPITADGRELNVHASLGVSVALPGDPRTAEDLLRDADAAMYHAKRAGSGGFRLFEPAMHADVLARLDLRTDLQRAIDAGELELHYQPVVALADGSTVGFEALMRWRHPERGLVSPLEFIPVAEETGLIVAMGRWALHEAAAHLRALGGDYRMNVNLSAKQLQDPGLVADVRSAIGDLDPGRFALELTESSVMEDIDVAIARLHELRALGVELALDDFGTGYSSLGYLSRLPVDVLKLDRTFLNGDAPHLIAAVVGLGQALNLRVVAEGIEEDEQWWALRALGCGYGQGFLFSRPLTAADSLAAVA